MLTYTTNPKPKRNDRPWLLFITALIWIAGSCFFHDPWEPYEPFVVAIVKSIIHTNSWLVPFISPNTPYLELQPFYFWIFALIIKLFNFTDIQNAVRLINAFIIFMTIFVVGKIGSGLSAYKNGRTTVMILISTVGFVNNAYQLSPHIVVLLGFALYLYALQRFSAMPGGSAILMACGLVAISLNFTAVYLLIALIIIILLPLINKHWRRGEYAITAIGGIAMFLIVFSYYAWQLYVIDKIFFATWQHQYLMLFRNSNDLVDSMKFYSLMISWYLIPGWFLVIWTFYRRRTKIFNDPILSVATLLMVFLLGYAIICGANDESEIFPIIIPVVMLASVEIDSIRITIVSLLNWFSIFIFGSAGLIITLLYISLNSGYPEQLFAKAQYFAPDYIYAFNFWQLLLALIITIIWIFMITRKHIRGREMMSNWASGSTFVLVMFVSLCIPWFNAVLTFRPLVKSSVQFLKPQSTCIATIDSNKIQHALWYYYADVRLVPEVNLSSSICNQAIVTMIAGKPELPGWRILWSAKRPVDFKTYYLIERN